MPNPLKVVVIGGGSSYTPELIEGFILRHQELPITELWLVDIDEGLEKLSVVCALAKRMVKKAGVDIHIEMTLDRKSALKDADFVINQIRVGQLDARLEDEMIPAKYGLLGQETVAAGGLFKALRTIPVVFDIIEDMKALCEDAWLINFSNPAGMVTEAVCRYGEFERFIGVCNVPVHMTYHFAEVLGIRQKDLIPIFAGLNHLSYVTQLYHKNKDCLKKLIASVKDQQMTMKNIDPLAYPPAFIEALGVYPGPYQKYYYHHQEMLESFLNQASNNQTRATIVKDVERELFEKYKDVSLEEKPEELSKRGGAYYSDAACSIISSIHNDKRDYHVINTINEGHITDLPRGCAIEITARMTKDGPIPVHIGRLPLTIRGLVQSMKAYEELVADAVFERDLEKARLALCLHPLTSSITKANQVFDALLASHAKYLTYYKEGRS